MNQVILGLLKDKTRILVTHAIDFIHMADRIIIMEEGRIVESGHLNDLIDTPIMNKLMEINNLNNSVARASDRDSSILVQSTSSLVQSVAKINRSTMPLSSKNEDEQLNDEDVEIKF